jgi:hypothetical protein
LASPVPLRGSGPDSANSNRVTLARLPSMFMSPYYALGMTQTWFGALILTFLSSTEMTDPLFPSSLELRLNDTSWCHCSSMKCGSLDRLGLHALVHEHLQGTERSRFGPSRPKAGWNAFKLGWGRAQRGRN